MYEIFHHSFLLFFIGKHKQEDYLSAYVRRCAGLALRYDSINELESAKRE